MLERIYLTGFMTCGKSTVGPILANTLGWDFFDLDDVIEEREKRKVVEVFKDEGEKYFRELETEILKEFSVKKNIVLALGGGTMANETNVMLMKRSGTTIYLKISQDMIYKRIKNKIDRPLFRDLVLDERPKEDFVNRINELMDKRTKFYELADWIIETENNAIGQTVDMLAAKINRLIRKEK